MLENEMGVDAHVPSDTEAFDNKVTEMKTLAEAAVTEEDKALAVVIQRFASFANFYLQNAEALGTNTLQIELFTNLAIVQAQLTYFSERFLEKDMGEIRKFKARIKTEMERRLSDYQVEHKIVITPQAVTVEEREGKIQVVKKEIPSAPIPEQEE